MKKVIKKILPAFVIGWYHKILAVLAAVIYGRPSDKLIVIGVTGTNGKSTVVNLIAELLKAGGAKVGLTATANFKIGEEESISVTLKTTTNSLENVVVNALGFETRKDKLGYATNRIGSESIGNSGEAGLLNALAGKSSGVRVARSSGDPGGASQILIRGQSTITRSTDPLIVLDGVPVSGDARNESSGGQIVQQSRLNDINPDDIANVQILKGASAAALWGTRAANGVIIITTKKGSSGGKANISFRSTVSFDKVSAFYDL